MGSLRCSWDDYSLLRSASQADRFPSSPPEQPDGAHTLSSSPTTHSATPHFQGWERDGDAQGCRRCPPAPAVGGCWLHVPGHHVSDSLRNWHDQPAREGNFS